MSKFKIFYFFTFLILILFLILFIISLKYNIFNYNNTFVITKNWWDYYNKDIYVDKILPNFWEEFYEIKYNKLSDNMIIIWDTLYTLDSFNSYRNDLSKEFREIVIFDIKWEKYVYFKKNLTLLNVFENKNHIKFKLDNYDYVKY